MKETAIKAGSGEEEFSGIEGAFIVRDEKGEMRVDPKTVFRLSLEGMGERDIPQVMEALGTLVQIGIRPQEVADFVADVELSRIREYVRAKFDA